MFYEIEKLFKKESANNKINSYLPMLYLTSLLILFVMEHFKIHFIFTFILLTIYTFFSLLYISNKVFNKKFKISLLSSDEETTTLQKEIHLQEKKLMKNYLISSNNYNEEVVKNIIGHYRNLIVPKISSVNFITIISIAIPIFAPVFESDLNILVLESYISYYVSLILIVAMLSFFYNQLKTGIKFFKKELGMYERLECIFSDILCDVIQENKCVKKENIITKIINKFLNF